MAGCGLLMCSRVQPDSVGEKSGCGYSSILIWHTNLVCKGKQNAMCATLVHTAFLLTTNSFVLWLNLNKTSCQLKESVKR